MDIVQDQIIFVCSLWTKKNQKEDEKAGKNKKATNAKKEREFQAIMTEG